MFQREEILSRRKFEIGLLASSKESIFSFSLLHVLSLERGKERKREHQTQTLPPPLLQQISQVCYASWNYSRYSIASQFSDVYEGRASILAMLSRETNSPEKSRRKRHLQQMVYLRPKLGEGEFSPCLRAARSRLADPPFSNAHARTLSDKPIHIHTCIMFQVVMNPPRGKEGTSNKKRLSYMLLNRNSIIQMRNIFSENLD